MAQNLRVDLSSLTAMRHTVISLRCIPQNSRLSATSGATNREYLFWTEFFFHGSEIMTRAHVQEWSILNSYGKLLAIRSWSQLQITPLPRYPESNLGNQVRNRSLSAHPKKAARVKPLKPRDTRRMIPSTI
jgi:hypothetical protein